MEMVVKKITPLSINGEQYLTPLMFAHLVGVAENTIYRLINKGNVFRKMRANKDYFGRPLIPIVELTEFPFTKAGRYPQHDVYHYTFEGERVSCFNCSVNGPENHNG